MIKTIALKMNPDTFYEYSYYTSNMEVLIQFKLANSTLVTMRDSKAILF